MSVNPSPQEETLTENSAFAELLNWPDSDLRDGPRRLILNGGADPRLLGSLSQFSE